MKVWNVRTMLDKANSSHPERCLAIIAHELSRLDIDIAALSEARQADEGSFQEVSNGFTLLWSGKPSTDKRLSGVVFMVRNSITSKLETSPTYHSDCIIHMRLPMKSNQHLTPISVYSPTPIPDPVDKTSFHSDLHRHLNSTPTNDKVLIVGEFNARVGRDSVAWKGVLGRHGVGN